MNIKLISWNINGVVPENEAKVTTLKSLKSLNPDIICLQEVKCYGISNFKDKLSLIDESLIHSLACNSTRGYSGVGNIFNKINPSESIFIDDNIQADIPCNPIFDKYNTGRILVSISYSLKLAIINVYIPNSGTDLVRLDYKEEWMTKFTEVITKFINDRYKVIVLGDVNVVPTKDDIKNWSGNYNKSPGCTSKETELYNNFIKSTGLVDVADATNKRSEYTFFGRFTERNKAYNAGWRLDHFWISPEIKIINYSVLKEYNGSDHVPILLEVEI